MAVTLIEQGLIVGDHGAAGRNSSGQTPADILNVNVGLGILSSHSSVSIAHYSRLNPRVGAWFLG